MNTIIMTTLSITAISAVLALILTIADRTVGDYGVVTMTINGEKEYQVDGGNTLLDTLRNESIFIPSACGGKGSCGYCKAQVLSGGGPVLATELPWLTKEEIEDNVRLTCQCKVKENIAVQIPEELFNVREYETAVV